MFVFPQIETKEEFQESGIGFEVTQEQAQKAAFEDAWKTNPLASFFRAQELEFKEKMEDSPFMTAEQWRQSPHFRDGLKFPDGVKENVAKLIADRKDNENQRRFVMSSGPQGISSKAGLFGIQFVAAALDPVNLAAAFIPVVREARFAQLTAKIGATPARLAKGGVEGTVGAAVVEPIVLGAAYQEQADYGMLDSLYAVGFGSVFGAGIHAGVGKIGDIAKKYRTPDTLTDVMTRYSDQVNEPAGRAAYAAMSEGKTVNVTPIYRMADIPEARLARDVEIEIDRLHGVDVKSQTIGELKTDLSDLQLRIKAAESKITKADSARRKKPHQDEVEALKAEQKAVKSRINEVKANAKKIKALDKKIEDEQAKKFTSPAKEKARDARVEKIKQERSALEGDVKPTVTVRDEVRAILREGENARKLGDDDAVRATEKELDSIIAGERGFSRYADDEELMRDIEAQNSYEADSIYSVDDINHVKRLSEKNDEGMNIDADLEDLDMEVKSALEADIMSKQDMDELIAIDKKVKQREESRVIAELAAMCGVK